MTGPVVVFVSVAYVLSIGLSVAIGLTGGQASPLLAMSVGSMFIPAIALIFVRFTTKETVSVDWACLPARYIPAALFLMPAAMHLTMLPLTAILTGGLPWQDWLKSHDNGIFHAPAQPGWGTLSAAQLALHIVLNALAGVIIVSILAFFEEIGWRAWLLPRVSQVVGERRAIVVVAIIWALWHIPFVASGIVHFVHVSKAHALLIMPVGEFGAGMVIGWFWVRTKSIWIVSIAHGALNNWGQFAFKFMQDRPAAAFGASFRSYETAVLTSGTLALTLLGTVLVWLCMPRIETADSRL